jgi:NAD(P)-dependent dehydrogenase (short-subunit alcohol dehydrogenase family)
MGEQKTIVITGANSGIGKITALELAKMGHRIIMVCRNKAKGEAALKELMEISGNSNIDLMFCDLSSLEDVKRFSEALKDQVAEIDVLINNAGVMSHERQLTQNGYEMHLQVNYLAPVLMTELLINQLDRKGRIINLTSMAHRVGTIRFDDLNITRKFSMLKAYSQSKLALTLYTYQLANRLKDREITVNCVHPGIIVSNLGVYKDRRTIDFLTGKLKRLFTSESSGAETSIYLASSDQVEGLTGHYFYKKKAKKSSKDSYDLELSKKLWSYTRNLLEQEGYLNV